MIRRAIAGAVIGLIGVVLPVASAQAITYPPAPPGPGVVVPDVEKKVPAAKKAVAVKAPAKKAAREKAVLVRTGGQSTVPLVATGTGLLLLGSTLAAIGRRRRSASGSG